uniref:Uncharacterized protein n=1 Tax=Tanacetum cinerariifolium TaxID=118510 RepID=A0A699LAE6_TANCI|nr:hypothetical protein [Tanacetum cinerariifolium]
MTSRQISSGLDLTYATSIITTQQPSEGELDLLFKAMYDDFISGQPSATLRTVPAVQEHQVTDINKMTKSKPKLDKTKHEMEMNGKVKVNQVKVKVKVKVKDRAETV